MAISGEKTGPAGGHKRSLTDTDPACSAKKSAPYGRKCTPGRWGMGMSASACENIHSAR
eukprot:COSAG02_NODE_248_length_27133_cov_45.131723_8_plen_59_part_00